MAIKRKLIECECGEQFVEGQNNQLTGTVKFGPWRFISHRLRSAKSTTGGDILAALFERSVGCGKCGFELIREKRQYEITPPVNPNKPEPIPSSASREFVVVSVPEIPSESGIS